MEKLKSAEAKSDEDLGIELGVGALEKGLQLVIELNLPTEDAENEGRGEIAVGRGEGVDGFGAQEIVRVRLAAFDGDEDLKCGFAR